MAGRFLNLFRPLSRFMPEVAPPKRRVGFNEKIFWTLMALVLYLVMSQVPLYGVGLAGGMELAALRVIFASNRGSLMELGIGPIVTAGLILQLLVGSGMVECDMSDPEDRALFTSASKVFSFIFIGFQASAYIIGGVYGALTFNTALIVFLQLLAAGMVVMLLDEMIQKGWGIGSGISLFIMAGVAQSILWDSFGLTPPMADKKSYGFFVALAETFARREPIMNIVVRVDDKGQALPYPTLLGFFATIAVFLIVIYMEGVRVELPLAYAGYRGFRSRYPIKLLYVSNLPVIFASALFANIYLFSQVFQRFVGRGFWIDLLGKFDPETGQPVSGLVYYVTAPRGITQVIADPVRAVGYVSIMVVFCMIFSYTWLEVGGLSPSTVAKQLVDSGMQIPGYRRSSKPIETILKRYIPVVAVLGGIIVGLIASVADFFGVFGTGMGILLSIGILYQYYELLMRERVAEMFPAFRKVFGG
jgi:preprotein translocase SecY subunit